MDHVITKLNCDSLLQCLYIEPRENETRVCLVISNSLYSGPRDNKARLIHIIATSLYIGPRDNKDRLCLIISISLYITLSDNEAWLCLIIAIYNIFKYGTTWLQGSTHWGRDKVAANFLTTFSSAFSWMKIHELWLRYHWSLFPRVQLTIFQH